MSTGRRNLILIVVLLTALAFIAYPRLFPQVPDDEDFQVTENPIQALAEAREQNRKVFLEFYQDG